MRISDWSSDVCSSDLRATLVFAGQTLVEYQARQAAQAGAGHISIHVNAITPPLSRSVDRLNADGISVSLVRTPAELRQTIPPDTDILLIGDGVIAAQSLYAEMARHRSEEHTSELQSLMRISYAVFCLKKKTIQKYRLTNIDTN